MLGKEQERIYDVVDSLRYQADQAIEQALKSKMAQLELAALMAGDYKLAEILRRIDQADKEQLGIIYANLKENGYQWEMERPEIQFDHGLDRIGVNMDMSQMKVRIWKKVIEV